MIRRAQGRKYTDNELEIINSIGYLYCCTNCKIEKPNSEFYKVKTKRRGRSYSCFCKDCRSKITKSDYNSSKKRRLKLVERNFGLNVQQYNQLYEINLFKCAICNIKEEDLDQRLSIDHNHITGKIRGLLCSKCNSALGLFKDNNDILENAIKYLEKYK